MQQVCLFWVFFCFIFGLISLIRCLLRKENTSLCLCPLDISGCKVLFSFLCFLALPFFIQQIGCLLFRKVTTISHLDLSLFLAFVSEIALGVFLYFLLKKNPLIRENLYSNFYKNSWFKWAWIGYCESLPLLFLVTVFWYYGMLLMVYYGLPIVIETQPIIRLLTENETLFLTKVFMGISIIVLAPICEELFFRGILLRFLNAHMSLRKALWVSAFVFAASHQHFASFLPLLFLGYWLGYYYIKTGDLRTNIGLHALFNGTNFILIFVAKL